MVPRRSPATPAVPWSDAWAAALYAPDGFFVAGEGPAAHFRTATHAAGRLVSGVLLRLVERHRRNRVLDVGAGRGELLTAVLRASDRYPLHGVDVVPRPTALDPRIGWSRGLHRTPAGAFDGALVVAWELLDDVPCPVLEVDDDGLPRTVLVEPATGRESLGAPADGEDLTWCRRWWPVAGAEPGTRVEVGRPRDEVWAGLVRTAAATRHGATLLAVDYHHTRDDRPPTGTLTGYRAGRAVPPVPDGRGDVTAHVALDAVAAAGERAGATDTELTTQRAALLDLGVRPAGQRAEGGLPLPAALAERSEVAELLDPGALGGFGWLVQQVPPER
jgi:SAM-dependent MidA family methyltransferase